MAKIILEDIKFNKKQKSYNKEPKISYNESANDEKPEYYKLLDSESNYYKKSEPKYIRKDKIRKIPKLKNNHRLINKTILLMFLGALFFALFYWSSIFLNKANINIITKKEVVNFNNKEFVASKDNNIIFEIMIKPYEKTRKIILTDTKDVSVKSKGSVILYNEYSTKPQSIIAKTFLVDDEGKTYNTDIAITIPGYKLDSNKKIIPGSISVGITAFLPGSVYSGSPENFHINAFKGTDKYKKIYGKLKDPLSGGISGVVYYLNDEDKKDIENFAEHTLKDDLFKQAISLIPSDYILYKDAMIFSYNIDENIMSEKPEIDFPIKGEISALLLKEDSLKNSIIKNYKKDISDKEIEEINIPNIKELSFKFTNPNQSISKELEVINFNLTGDLSLIWNPNLLFLKSKLAGIEKKEAPNIFKDDPGIFSAKVKIFPPWKNYIPRDLSKIIITEE